ncbi:MAG: fatty acid desaturase family protein [Gemmata sp.]
MKLVDKQLLLDLHKPGWAAFRLTVAYTSAFFALLAAVGWAVAGEQYALLVPLVLVQAFVMHAHLIAFHEAAHGALCPVGFINGYLGRVTGLFSFMSLTLYRASHHWHHAYIGDVRDEEFWPLNDPSAGKGKRRLAAFCELFLGLAWTPFLFLRSFLRKDTAVRAPAVRRLIWAELVALALFWAAIVAAVAWFGAWGVLVAGYLIPAVVAGNVQSWRKYIEHVGLTGARAVALTRSVRNPSRAGRVLAWLLFQEPYHDVHHLYPKVPQEALPTVAAAEHPLPPELPVFRTYSAALADLLRGLGDPKFGKAWAPRREGVKG